MKDSSLQAGLELNGSYRLLRPLGRGGMGEVWEAEHLRLPKRVAVKFLLASIELGPEWLSRFKREADIASRLRHPNIVEVHDYNVLDDGTPYLVMEKLEGQELRARLEQGPLGVEEAREIVLQVASALSLAHREGVVHRDLKPENVFLHRDADGRTRAKVLDFGISKMTGGAATHATQENTLLGTPGYMAPEQAMGKHKQLDGRADLFSLAAILYEMLTGHTLFCGDSLAEVVYKVVHHEPEPLRQISPVVPEEISLAVARALSKDPSDRQPTIEAFVRSLDSQGGFDATAFAGAQPDSLPGGAPVEAEATRSTQDTAATRPAASAPPSETRGPMLGFAAAALLAVLAAAAFWVSRDGGASAGGPPSAASADGKVEAKSAQVAAEENVQAQAVEQAEPFPTEPREAGAVAPAADAVGETTQVAPAESPASAETATRTETRLPKAVRDALAKAETRLDAGDHAGAIRLATRSLATEKSSEAYAVMAKAHCLSHNLGMVRAMLRNVRRAERREVRAYCKAHGLDLQ